VNKRSITVRLLTHGKFLSGGTFYEEYFLKAIAEEINKLGILKRSDEKNYNKIFRGIDNLTLLFSGWQHSNANVNIVAGRLALSSIFRNLLNKKKTLIVLHNFDPKDGKSWYLAIYYRILFSVLKLKPSGIAVICVSPFFKNYFSFLFPHLPVFHFPNLFKVENYLRFRRAKDPKKIFLGQYSSKNDNSVFELAKLLHLAGYYCFFLTLNPGDVQKTSYFEVRCVKFDEYLSEMAESYCTIAFSGVNEGWPRLVHESVLVGTTVIGYDKGGLGDLLRESSSYIVKSAMEALELIKSEKVINKTSQQFVDRYDTGEAPLFLQPVIKFILED
jgi:hypothetical protein